MHLQNTNQRKGVHMCEKCDMQLLSASQTALNLASAAQVLGSINATTEARVLAKAAADLFTPVKTAGEVTGQEHTTATTDQNAQGIKIDEATGDVYFQGVCIGRAVVVRRT